MNRPDGPALVARAAAAREQAHAPYSRFRVGAAVLTDTGDVFTGCNVENVSFGLTQCAERVAMGTAVAAGAGRLAAVAIVADGDRATYPCGACRQVLAEFGAPDTVLYLAPGDHPAAIVETTLGALLPRAFTGFKGSTG